MRLHTVFVTYNRFEITKQAIETYLETVTVPHTFVVVDNASSEPEMREWLESDHERGVWILLDENRYPGHACNRGWSLAPPDATHLHRADNDFAFLPGWCEEVERVFESKIVGQVGLRTGAEEENGQYNVGGNCVIRRELWDRGLRYDERPWSEYPPGYTEDSLFSPAVEKMGFNWTRVQKPCIVSLANEDPNDPYYVESWTSRGILDWARERHA